jgi:hypothetical protein
LPAFTGLICGSSGAACCYSAKPRKKKTIVTESKPSKSMTFATATVIFHTSNFIDPQIPIRSTEREECEANESS